MSKRSYVPWRPLGEPSVVALAETFKVLGDVTRVRILDALARVRGGGAPGLNNALCVQDLATLLGMTQSAVSHQLRLLRSMRLVRTRRDGRQIFYALDDDHIVKLFEQGLEHVEEQLGASRANHNDRRRAS
jgi:ArsR family transcriptional regulator, lead/cadmium/zinc/bismuth-responsive transcriptional repressor